MSRLAPVSGTFVKPLYTATEYYLSLGLFFLIYAGKPWFIHTVYGALTRWPADDTSGQPST